MSSRVRDPAGTGGAFLVGMLVGLALAAPVLPRELPLAPPALSVGPVGRYLLAGVLAVVAVPLCMALLHILFLVVDGLYCRL